MNVFLLFVWIAPVLTSYVYLKAFSVLNVFFVCWSVYYFCGVLDHIFYWESSVDKEKYPPNVSSCYNCNILQLYSAIFWNWFVLLLQCHWFSLIGTSYLIFGQLFSCATLFFMKLVVSLHLKIFFWPWSESHFYLTSQLFGILGVP